MFSNNNKISFRNKRYLRIITLFIVYCSLLIVSLFIVSGCGNFLIRSITDPLFDDPDPPVPPTYTVIFNSRGGSAVPQIDNVTHGTTITAPAPPTSGYGTFDAWYSDSERMIPFIFGVTQVISDITLYAKWNPTYELGDLGPGNGTIYYRTETGMTVEGYGNPGDKGYFASYRAYYLELAPNDAGTAEWGDMGFLVNDVVENMTSRGIGRRNTMLIVAHMESKGISGTAAQLAASETTGGKDDWFLPSMTALSNIPLTPLERYWISEQTDQNRARYAYRSGTSVMSAPINKDTVYPVRAVRAF